MNPVEEAYRVHHVRLWRALLAYTGDGEAASEAEAETYSQALARGDALRDPAAWIWRTAFRVAAGIMAERRAGPLLQIVEDEPRWDQSLTEFLDLLTGLSEQQRLVVVLRYAGGFKPSEIASLLDSTPNSIRVQLHRAHTHLREGMEMS